MKKTPKPKHAGFTLVELLVVIVIVAALAALAMTIGPKMLAKGKATESMENMRQLSPILTTYATENSMTLPAIRGPVKQNDGTTEDRQWNEVCLALLYPETDPKDFQNKSWWNTNKCILKNPLFKDGKGWAPLNPGYAMNQMISQNIEDAKTDGSPAPSDPLEAKVALAMIPDPARTPLIAPFTNYYYTFDDSQINSFSKGNAKDLLMDSRIPVVFVDGHVETMTPKEYGTRDLAKMPIADSSTGP